MDLEQKQKPLHFRTEKKALKLCKAYEDAVAERRVSLTFGGHLMATSYTRYVLEYLSNISQAHGKGWVDFVAKVAEIKARL